MPKFAGVCTDQNKKWFAYSVPFPSQEVYGTNENGDGICETKEEAIKAAQAAGCTVLEESVIREQYV